jgi:hypothetical protein
MNRYGRWGNRNWVAALAIAGGCVGMQACGDNQPPDEGGPLAALMSDGDAGRIAPGAGPAAPGAPLPGRFCPSGDCARDPLAMWRLDDCNGSSTQLADTAFTSSTSHPAFRAVSVACVPAMDALGLKLSVPDDVAYAPDQPDFVFSSGLTVAAWINPDSVSGSQSLVRKRLDGSSSFLLAIDSRKLHFVLRLTNGRFVDVAASIMPGRFTHVAATYDGNQATLYLDGAPAASARIQGAIAPGAGPILIGNDASGRRFNGVVDTIWLNTLAAPADTIRSLLCVHRPPSVALTPGQSPPQTAGASVSFDLAVTSNSSAACPADQLFFAPQVFYPLATNTFSGVITAAPGMTAHATVDVSSAPQAQVGAYTFQVIIYDNAGNFVPTSATYVVGSAHVSTGIPLVADQNGHYDGSNAAGILGNWWSGGDDYGPDGTLGGGSCRADGFPASACSTLTAPNPAAFFQPDANGRMCASGVVGQVIPDATGTLAWGAIWGDIIGFDVNNSGMPTDGVSARLPYDTSAHGITGFAFDIDAVPPGGNLRVAFQTPGTESGAAWWGGASSNVSPIFSPGHYEIRWPEVGGPNYIPNPPPFDPTKLLAIDFHVVANQVGPVPFSFCLSNLMMLTN